MMTPSPIDWTQWQGVIHATLMFIVKDGRILLIEKKRGLGAGKNPQPLDLKPITNSLINAPGGGVLGKRPANPILKAALP